MITIDPHGIRSSLRFYCLYVCALLVSQIIGYLTFYGLSSSSAIWPSAGVYGGLLVVSHKRHWPAMIILMILVDQGMFMIMSEAYQTTVGQIMMIIKLVYNPLIGVVFACLVDRYLLNRNPIANMWSLTVYSGIAIFLNLSLFSLIVWYVASQVQPDIDLYTRWMQWSFSGISGLLVYATPIIVIANRWGGPEPLIIRKAETSFFGVVLTLVSIYLFVLNQGSLLTQLYQCLFLLVLFGWAFERFNSVVITSTCSVLFSIIVIGMSIERGPFHVENREPIENVLRAQGILVPTILLILFITSLLESIREQHKAQLITERKMGDLDRARSLGTMASGVAHDFGNLSIALRAYHDILRKRVGTSEDESIRNAIEGISSVAEGAQSLTSALLLFARDDSIEDELAPKVADLCHAIQKAQRTIEPMYQDRYKIVSRVPPESVWVGMSGNSLSRLLGNLIINALDASDPGQQVTMTLYNRDGHARLVVADHGKGIAPDIMSRIAEPFFTTKPRGRGTGLGLAIVKGLVRDANGDIEIDSTPGVGTSITITLPIVDPPSDQTDASTDP